MNPILEDRMVGWSGSATRRAAPGKLVHYERATGRSKTRASRHRRGDKGSPSFANNRYIDQLARHDRTSAWAQITTEMGIAKRVQFEGKSLEKLRDRLHELTAGEHARQAAQDAAIQIASLTGDWSGVREPAMEHADALVEIAFLSDEISDLEARGR